MIRSLQISNFYSIKEPQRLDLVVAKNAPDLPDRFARPVPDSEERIPKVVAIFGPNASGKTTVLRAISFLQWFACYSFDQMTVGGYLPFSSFEDRESWNGVTNLSVEFDAQLVEHHPRCFYRYEISIQNSVENPPEIISERLKFAPKGKFRRVFERDTSGIKSSEEFQISKNDPRRQTVRQNVSLISTFAKFAHPLAEHIVRELSALQTNVLFASKKFDFPEDTATKYYFGNPNIVSQLNKRIRIFDIGIEKVDVVKEKDGPQARFTHTGLEIPLTLDSESNGTRNFYKMFPHLNYVLDVGGIAVIDEFDVDVHPLLLPEIVGWFQDESINKHNAQLIMSCHNATLLEHLVKEEVCFTEKDKGGQTQIFALQDVKGVRRDANIYEKYLGGVFGAVPHIG